MRLARTVVLTTATCLPLLTSVVEDGDDFFDNGHAGVSSAPLGIRN